MKWRSVFVDLSILTACFAVGFFIGMFPGFFDRFFSKSPTAVVLVIQEEGMLPKDIELQLARHLPLPLKVVVGAQPLLESTVAEADLFLGVLTIPWTEKRITRLFSKPRLQKIIAPDFINDEATAMGALPLFWRVKNQSIEVISLVTFQPGFDSPGLTFIKKALEPQVQSEWIVKIPFQSTLLDLDLMSIPQDKKSTALRSLQLTTVKPQFIR